MSANLKESGHAQSTEDRVASALRENLRKRKQQQQARAGKDKKDGNS